MEYIENRLIGGPLAESVFDLFHLSSDDAIIFYPSIKWKKKICSQLEISFETSIEQHSSLNRHKLENLHHCDAMEIVSSDAYQRYLVEARNIMLSCEGKFAVIFY